MCDPMLDLKVFVFKSDEDNMFLASVSLLHGGAVIAQLFLAVETERSVFAQVSRFWHAHSNAWFEGCWPPDMSVPYDGEILHDLRIDPRGDIQVI